MDMELNVLIVDDSENDAILIMRELTRVYNAIHERVKNPDEMAAALERRNWDLVICDYIIPGFSAFTALEMLRKKGFDIPFIVVSGKVDDDIAVDVMKAGASDYVLKDRLSRLLPVVKREMGGYEIRSKSRKMIKELKESDERYRDICENANDLIYVAMAEGKILYANPSFQKTTGYKEEELQKMKISDLVHPEYTGYWNSVIERILATEKSEKIELCLLTKKMETIYLEGDCGIKYEKSGGVQLRGLLRDVTNRKKTEVMWEKYKAIVNTSSEFMTMVNREYVFDSGTVF